MASKTIIKTFNPRQEKSSFYYNEIDLLKKDSHVASIYFATNSTDLTSDDKKVLDWVAGVFNLVAASNNVYLIIRGYTDERGSKKFNKNLSFWRAYSVKSYLDRLPQSSNFNSTVRFEGEIAGRKNLSENRRVDIHSWVYEKQIDRTPPEIKKFIEEKMREMRQGFNDVILRMNTNPNKTSLLVPLLMKYFRMNDLLGDPDEKLVDLAQKTLEKCLLIEITNYMNKLRKEPYDEKQIENLAKLVRIASLLGVNDKFTLGKANEILFRHLDRKKK